MIEIERAREHLLKKETLLYREHDGRIAYTLWKSQRTPERYYWYTIHDEPILKHESVDKLYESGVFYDLEELLNEFK